MPRAPDPSIRKDTTRDVVVLVLVCAALFLIRLGARDLWNPNEPLYGRAVVEMLRSGDWSLPTVNGRVFDEKPILYFWLALTASRIAGSVNELTLRLPSALAGLLGVAFVYLLVRPYAASLRARLAATLFATMEIVFWSARSAQMDLLLAVCTLGTVLAVSRVVDHDADARVGWALAGVSAGLGVLAKGPLGLVCPVLALATYITVRPASPRAREERAGFLAGRGAASRLAGPAIGVSSLLVVAAPWYAWLAARGQWSVLQEMLVRQNFTRFVSAWDHVRPWWYYLEYLWIDMAPWAFFLPFAVALPGRRTDERRLDRLAWAWLGSLLVFFSLSASKRSPYLLPAAPAVAILASAPIEHWIRGTLDPGRRVGLRCLIGVLGTGLAVAGLALAYLGVREYAALLTAGRVVATLLVGGGLAVLAASVLLGRRHPLAPPAALGAVVVALYVIAAVWVLPTANEYKSARPFCEQVSRIVPAGRTLRSYRSWEWRASYAFYADRTIDSIDSARDLERYWEDEAPVFLLVEQDRLDEVRAILGPVAPILTRRVGGNTVYLFSNG